MRFTGWGVDASSEMCRLARDRVAANGLSDRITILEGDVLRPEALGPVPTDLGSLTVSSVLNGLWDHRHGRPTLAEWLRSLATAFPGAMLVVVDYFGRLGSTPPPWHPSFAVHDLVRALSGQGIPPSGHDPWMAAYREAGAHPVHVTESSDKSFFLHLLELPVTSAGRDDIGKRDRSRGT